MTTPDAPLTPRPATPPTPTPAVPTPVQPIVVARRSGGGRWLNVLLGLAAVIAIGGVAFAIGRSTAPVSAAGAFPNGGFVTNGPTGSFDPGAGFPQGRPGGPGAIGGGLTIEGTVTGVDADGITIRLASGDELTIATDTDTTYHESTATDASAVQVGDEVAIQADGGRFTIGDSQGQGAQGADPGEARGLTAGDVTVRR